ncbi:VanZ family protein [Chitinispirillales bacterium ANBcel5]|uniref:VanZ family protein n=1 Tax=Cellulosispirillum alkaliphilum TaxID=3039283 RepID=UPI002A5236B9|nr:VanZ family protein [Chitinispirillales bacterium ANBcel5]
MIIRLILRHKWPVRVVFILMISLIYYFGLRPFNFYQENEVHRTEHGLFFGPLGIAYTPERIIRPNATGLTLEFTLIPSEFPNHSVPTIITFADNEGKELVTIGQWKESIIIRRHDSKDVHKSLPEVSTSSLLNIAKPVFISIISDSHRGAIFVDGELISESEYLSDMGSILRDGTQLIIANNASGTSPWSGILSSISLYSNRLPLTIVKEHFYRYKLGISSHSGRYPPFMYYILNAQMNSTITDLISGEGLLVPERFGAPRQDFLVPIWVDFIHNRSYYQDIITNYLGFLPMGIISFVFFSGLFKSSFEKKSVLLTVLLGFGLSLSIEYLQIYLPTRSSQLSDLIFNTLGATTGALMMFKYQQFYRKNKAEPI